MTPLCVLMSQALPVMTVVAGLGQLRIRSFSKHLLSAWITVPTQALITELLE